MSKPILRAKGIHRTYGAGHAAVKVLRGASLEASEAEFLVIMGASGCGKSTLLHVLGALDAPDRGTVEFRGENIFNLPPAVRGRYRNRDVGFVFQFYHLLPELNVLENVVIPRLVTHSYWSWRSARRESRKEAAALLDRMGLADRAKHRPNQLSGGEKQRVAIARALINRPALLLADEPTGNLDEKIGSDILKLLVELNVAGQTIIMVTHDAKVASLAHRRVHLSEGVIRETVNQGGAREYAVPTITKVALL
jgi:ABC-type lipoprotein export system ATPase subunit